MSHHPPIGVSETTSKDYTLQLETELKSKFYGNSSEVFISGTNHLKIHKTGERITWGHLVYVLTLLLLFSISRLSNKVFYCSSCCHNIILGSLWLDHYGDLTIINNTTGEKCLMKFTKAGWLGAGRYVVSGDVFDKDGNIK